MATLSHSKSFIAYPTVKKEITISPSLISLWTNRMEIYRYPLMVAIISIQGCVLIPITLLLSLFWNVGISGLTLFGVTLSTMAVMVTNMALTPMKVIIWTFILSVLINCSLILYHTIAILL